MIDNVKKDERRGIRMAWLPKPSQTMKWICILFAAFLLVELIALNIFFLWTYSFLKQTMSPMMNIRDGSTLADKVLESKLFHDTVAYGKSGQFVSILQETVERLFMIIPEPSDTRQARLGTFGVDVSHSGEFLFIYKRMLMKKKKPYVELVVDVGANDGLMSSNSFNLIQLGWKAILVEPVLSQANMARNNIIRYVDENRDRNQTVKIVNSALCTKDGAANFVLNGDIAEMEGHIMNEDFLEELDPKKRLTQVSCLSVSTFVRKYHVPKNFGVLSIDAEGVGNEILHNFIGLGFRPEYIIYEDLHERSMEHPEETKLYLTTLGYTFLTRRGWNIIFERSH